MRTTARVLALLAAGLVLAGCAGNVAFSKGEKLALEGDWDRAVAEYRRALQDDPDNISYKTRLTKAQDMAATRHNERAVMYLKEKNGDAALHEATQALELSPMNDKARQLLDEASRQKETETHYQAGLKYYAAGRPNEAYEEFMKVLQADPGNAAAKAYIEKITQQKLSAEEEEELALGSDQPVTLSFKDARLKEVFEFLSKLSDISILFDDDVKDVPVTVFARDVSFMQALKLLLATNKLFMKKIAEDAIIIIPNTKSKQDQYQDLLIKTYYLSNAQAKDMVNIIRTMLETRKVIINETLNAITLRETPEKLKLVEKLISANDRKDAEVVIDVEVLSVDRGPDSTTYGISLPQNVNASFVPTGGVAPGLTGGVINAVTTNLTQFKGGYKTMSDVRNNIWFTYPSVTAFWGQTRSKAETLTNPQIRTLNNKQAKILIGSRIPVQTGTIVATGGQLTSAFEYRDVGIKLTVEPNVGLQDDVTLKTVLEVSSLGAKPVSVGGTDQPAFNTTTAEAILNLKNGESVIIGGLLENVTSDSITGIAGLMDVPILGKIFSKNVIGDNRKRELVMVLTPHVVRSKEMPPPDIASFWSGTEEAYSTKPLFEEKKEKLSIPAPEEIEVPEAPPPAPEAAPGAAPAVPGAAPEGGAAPPAPQVKVAPRPSKGGPTVVKRGVRPEETMPSRARIGRVGTLSFAPEVAPVEVGQEMTIDVMATDLDTVFEAPLSIIYNPKLVEFMKADEGEFMKSDGKPTSFMASANDKVGYIDIFVTRLGKVPGISGTGRLFSLTFKGLAPGISPLVFKQNTLADPNKESVPADLKTGTLYIR